MIGSGSRAAGATLACLVVLVAPGRSAEVDALLDQVIAGCEGNLAMIEAGSAKYSITTSFADGRKPVSERAALWIDGPRLRVDLGDARMIELPDRLIDFQAPYLGTDKQLAPHNYSVIILPPSPHPRTGMLHPRMQGVQGLRNIAVMLRAARAKPDVWTLAATMEGKIIRVTEVSEANFIKTEVWVDPDQGYGVVRFLQWSKARNLPAVEVHSKYRRANHGAFVVSECRQVLRKPEADGYRDDTQVDIALQEISLGEKPDEKLFTIEGLGLPEGVPIQDRIQNRQYVYGASVATEGGIVSGPARSGSRMVWLLGVGAIFGVAVVCLLLRRFGLARSR